MFEKLPILLLIGLITLGVYNCFRPKEQINYTGEFSLSKISNVTCDFEGYCNTNALFFRGAVEKTPVEFGLNTQDLLNCGYQINLKLGQVIKFSGVFTVKQLMGGDLKYDSVETTEIDNVKNSACKVRSY